jgi:carboxypeptidase D
LATEYSGSSAFRSSLYKNLTLSGSSEIFGQVRQAGKFSFVRVYNAGHEVPLYQPVISQEVWHRAIFGKDIATGKEDTKAETGTKGGGTYESFPKHGMDPGPFLSLDGTRTVTAQSPTATVLAHQITPSTGGDIHKGAGESLRPNLIFGVLIQFLVGITVVLST